MVGKSDDDLDLDQYGRGDYDELTGTWEYYELPDDVYGRINRPAGALTWRNIWEHFDAIECDLQDIGIDLSSGILSRRTGRWLRVRILGLLMADTRLARSIANRPKQPDPNPGE